MTWLQAISTYLGNEASIITSFVHNKRFSKIWWPKESQKKTQFKNARYCKQFSEQVNCNNGLDYFLLHKILHYLCWYGLFLHSPQSASVWLKILNSPNTCISIADFCWHSNDSKLINHAELEAMFTLTEHSDSRITQFFGLRLTDTLPFRKQLIPVQMHLSTPPLNTSLSCQPKLSAIAANCDHDFSWIRMFQL